MGSFSIKNKSGFTIVELLIVIVVIGILAAITIVAYGGITARANTVKAQTNAANTQKVAETYNADPSTSNYPASATALTTYNGLTKMPTGITVIQAALNGLTSGNATTTVEYMDNAGAAGGCIAYYDATIASPYLQYVFVGTAKTANFNIATPTCA